MIIKYHQLTNQNHLETPIKFKQINDTSKPHEVTKQFVLCHENLADS